MRSVVVVLPASMWAMMPMFLQRSNGTVLGTTISSFWAPTSVDLAIGRLSDLAIQKLQPDRKSTRLNSSHLGISYAVFCLQKKKHPSDGDLVAILVPCHSHSDDSRSHP